MAESGSGNQVGNNEGPIPPLKELHLDWDTPPASISDLVKEFDFSRLERLILKGPSVSEFLKSIPIGALSHLREFPISDQSEVAFDELDDVLQAHLHSFFQLEGLSIDVLLMKQLPIAAITQPNNKLRVLTMLPLVEYHCPGGSVRFIISPISLGDLRSIQMSCPCITDLKLQVDMNARVVGLLRYRIRLMFKFVF